MFCYYNTLAWEILAAVFASVIVLATLPFVVTDGSRCNIVYLATLPFVVIDGLRCNILGAIITTCALLLVGALFLFRYLRNFAARWISLPCENDSTSPRAWIDYVEAGDWDWKKRRSPRARGTYAALIFFIALALAYCVGTWYWVGLVVLK